MDRDPPSSPLGLLTSKRTELSPSHRKIADFVLGHPFQAAMMGIEELAAASGVSIATVNRFVRALGFGGYAEFRGASLRAFRSATAPIEKLRDQKDRPLAAFETMRKCLHGIAANVTRSEHLLGRDACESGVAAILEARRVIIVALGIAAPLARLVGDLLEPYIAALEVLDGRGGPERMIRRVMRVAKGDLLVALTVPRYSRLTLDLLRTGREQGARTIALTDGPNSPVAPFCDIVMFGAAEHEVLHGSCVGILALAEGLAAALAQRQQTVADATELTKRILPHLFVDGANLAS
jgi:DNA-binding MurR/RpiR family transcriptional regulator